MMAKSSGESLTTTSLIVRVKQFDDTAWERLAALYTPVVFQWAINANLQESDAADLVQDVFSAVARNIERFERAPHLPRFRAWLWGITRHKLQDHFRRRGGQPRAVGGETSQQRLEQLPEEPPEDAGDENIDGVFSGLARRALALIESDFQEKTWQAFWRFAIDGRQAKEVAAELGMSVGAVYTAKSRVLAHLRRELEGLD